MVWIGIIEQLSRSLATRALKGLRISFPEFRVLNHFTHRPDEQKTVMSVAGAMQLPQPNVTKIVQRLLRKGLIAASPNPEDGRSKLLGITPRGRDVQQKAILKLQPNIERALGTWSDEEMREFFRLLDRLKVHLDENR